MHEVLVKSEEFKDSTVGRIPKDWKTVTLKDEINLLHGYAFEGKYFSDRPSGEVLLVPGNFHREGGLYFDENNTKYYQGAIPSNTVLNNGDLLIVMTDLSPRTLILGRVVQLELPFKVLHNQRIGKIIPKLPDTWDKRFLMLVMNSDRVRRNIISNATGTTVRHTSPDRITANVLPKPSRQEQTKITEILDTVDEAIARTSSLITKLKQTKAGLLQDLLTRGLDDDGKLRDPEAHPEQFNDSPLGKIPKEWEVRTCESVCREIVVGIVIKPSQYYKPSGVPVLRSANVREAGLDPSDLVFMSEQSNRILAKSMIRTGDVLTVRTGYPGTSCVVYPDFDGANCVDIIISRPSAEIDSAFLATWINSDSGKGQVLRVQGGLAQQHFNVGELQKLLIAKPSIEEQRAIQVILDTHNTRICTEEAYLNKIKLQKQGLMQDLLTGKVRVKNL